MIKNQNQLLQNKLSVDTFQVFWMIWAKQCRRAMHVGQCGSCPFLAVTPKEGTSSHHEERHVTTLDKLKANE